MVKFLIKKKIKILKKTSFFRKNFKIPSFASKKKEKIHFFPPKRQK
jgi:hypothetical protein